MSQIKQRKEEAVQTNMAGWVVFLATAVDI
jgi:hypothetical protein